MDLEEGSPRTKLPSSGSWSQDDLRASWSPRLLALSFLGLTPATTLALSPVLLPAHSGVAEDVSPRPEYVITDPKTLRLLGQAQNQPLLLVTLKVTE